MTGRAALGAVVVVYAGACSTAPPPPIPGNTSFAVSEVSIAAPDGRATALDPGPLLDRLGVRRASLLLSARPYNPFRLAEDRRRIRAYWQSHGYFEVQVERPSLRLDHEAQTATIRWIVDEGPRSHVASVQVVGAPPGQRAALAELAPFSPGDPVDLDAYRQPRWAMAEHLQRAGWAHARVYSRAFVHRPSREVHLHYYVDAGPRTVVGTIRVEGHREIAEATILDRLGFAPGDPYDATAREMAELALLDTGAFQSVVVDDEADRERFTGPRFPDTGGVLDDARIDERGRPIPRELPREVDLTVSVVEAPAFRARAEAGFEIDPSRADAFVGAGVLGRNLLGELHHLELRGRVAHGWTLSDEQLLDGPYGSASLRWDRAGWPLGALDLHAATSFSHELFPPGVERRLEAEIGLRATVARRTFLHLDLRAQASDQLEFGPFDPEVVERLSLTERDSRGIELELGLIRDRRDDRLEPLSGTYLALSVLASPGGAVATHRYLRPRVDGRWLLPLAPGLSLGTRIAVGAILLEDEGVPLGVRLFGGGSWGMRGFSRQHLSPTAPCPGREADCRVPVGGLSLAETSLELRYLPPRTPVGAVVFVDLGLAPESRTDPLEAPSAAVGLGGRLRTWYAPVALDVAYRVVDRGAARGPIDLGSWLLFLRIGEAF